MREIKFRGRDIINECWIDTFKLILSTDGSLMAVQDLNGEQYGNHQVEIVRFTGLKDKNGKEIYEGDIVRSQHFSNSEVLFKNGIFLACDTPLDLGYDGVYEDEEWEVIGNIYENPELL